MNRPYPGLENVLILDRATDGPPARSPLTGMQRFDEKARSHAAYFHPQVERDARSPRPRASPGRSLRRGARLARSALVRAHLRTGAGVARGGRLRRAAVGICVRQRALPARPDRRRRPPPPRQQSARRRCAGARAARDRRGRHAPALGAAALSRSPCFTVPILYHGSLTASSSAACSVECLRSRSVAFHHPRGEARGWWVARLPHPLAHRLPMHLEAAAVRTSSARR